MKLFIKFVVIFFVSLMTTIHAETININTADSALITQELKGIGPVKAEAIVDYRNKNGAFKELNDLLNIMGIGTKTLEQIKDQIIFEDPSKTLTNPKPTNKVKKAKTSNPAK